MFAWVNFVFVLLNISYNKLLNRLPFLYFKFKDKIDEMTLGKSRTAVEKFSTIFNFINKIAYFVGVEFQDDWHFSNRRSMRTLLLIIVISWLLVYSLCVEFPTLSCVELLGGSSLVVMVSD